MSDQEKQHLMDIKELEEKDWKGLFTAGSMVLLAMAMVLEYLGLAGAIATVLPVVTLAFGYYFGATSK